MAGKHSVRNRLLAAIAAGVVLVTLGGGSAISAVGGTAFSDAKTGNHLDQFKKVATITGIGIVQVNCDTTGGTNMKVRVKNSLSGKQMNFLQDTGAANPSQLLLDPNEVSAAVDVDGVDTIRYHAFPANGDEAPQADFAVSAIELGCTLAPAAVIGVTTP